MERLVFADDDLSSKFDSKLNDKFSLNFRTNQSENNLGNEEDNQKRMKLDKLKQENKILTEILDKNLRILKGSLQPFKKRRRSVVVLNRYEAKRKDVKKRNKSLEKLVLNRAKMNGIVFDLMGFKKKAEMMKFKSQLNLMKKMSFKGISTFNVLKAFTSNVKSKKKQTQSKKSRIVVHNQKNQKSEQKFLLKKNFKRKKRNLSSKPKISNKVKKGKGNSGKKTKGKKFKITKKK
jgi:hypothetical protein